MREFVQRSCARYATEWCPALRKCEQRKTRDSNFFAELQHKHPTFVVPGTSSFGLVMGELSP